MGQQPTEQESYGGPPHDRYGDVSAFSEHPPNNPHNDSQVSDSFYRDSPLGERYNVQKGQGNQYNDDGYVAPTRDRYNDQYGDDNRYGDQYGQPDDDRYLSMQERMGNMGLEEPRYPNDSHGPEGYRGNDGPINDSYRDQMPQEQTFGDYDDSPYRQDDKHHGLPKVHQDPFADDPFQSKENLAHRDQFDGHHGDRYRDEPPEEDSYPGPEDPYRHGGPPMEESYMGRGQPNEEDSFTVRVPPGDDRYRDEDPYSGRQPPREDNPYGSRHLLQDEDQYPRQPDNGPPSPGSDRYGNMFY